MEILLNWFFQPDSWKPQTFYLALDPFIKDCTVICSPPPLSRGEDSFIKMKWVG